MLAGPSMRTESSGWMKNVIFLPGLPPLHQKFTNEDADSLATLLHILSCRTLLQSLSGFPARERPEECIALMGLRLAHSSALRPPCGH